MLVAKIAPTVGAILLPRGDSAHAILIGTMSDAPTPPIISLSHVTKKYRRFAAVEDVSLEVARGEIVGFVGENGAGKTTTISMLLGFIAPTKGDIRLFGERVRAWNAQVSHRDIGYAAGDMELPRRMTGEQYLKFVMSHTKKQDTKRYDALVASFQPQLKKKIGTLSRGNKQKIALVAALVNAPKLVILDEPTSGLDPVMQEVFLDTIRREAVRGTTVFMSSHYLQEVAEVCSRVVLMKDGRIVEDLSAEDLAKHGGKNVTVIAKGDIKLPHGAKRQESHRGVSFGYTGNMTQLVEWLVSLKDVEDVRIEDRTLEDEFRHIYSTSKSEDSDE